MSGGTRVYKLSNWTIFVPEVLLFQDDNGRYFIHLGGDKSGPFETEKDLAVWLLKHRTETIKHGIMTEYKAPPQYIALCIDSREDVLKIMEAMVSSGIAFQYAPQTIESVFVYMLLIRKEDRNAAHHAMDMIK